MTIRLEEEEVVHLAELLKSDVIARQVLGLNPTGYVDESSDKSKAILIKFTLAAMGIYDKTDTGSESFHFSGNPRLN